MIPADDGEDVRAFWRAAAQAANPLHSGVYLGPDVRGAVEPPTWSFGGMPEQADELLGLVLAGAKTATASALWDYEAAGESIPERGQLGIVLDSAGRPRALLATTDVRVVAFDAVDEEHARLEGEGDLSLGHWREVHEEFFTETAEHDRGFAPDMPVVLERFAVVYQD